MMSNDKEWKGMLGMGHAGEEKQCDNVSVLGVIRVKNYVFKF